LFKQIFGFDEEWHERMDLKSRLEELGKAHAAGQLSEIEWVKRRQELLNEPATVAIPNASRVDTVATEPDSMSLRLAGLNALEPGTVIGPPDYRFRLLQELEGKRVWLALLVASDSERAKGVGEEFRVIKLFLPTGYGSSRESGRDERSQRVDLLGSRTYLAKVRSRVEQAIKLNHPHIARIYGWRQGADGWSFAETEYVDPQRGGASLDKFLREQSQASTWDMMLKWLRPVAAALDYARQEQRLAHQHLDAHVIVPSSQGPIKVLGFGLASDVVEPQPLLFNTNDGTTKKNSDSAAEAVSADTGFQRDVFALALLVYQMLAGQSAYAAKSEAANTVPRPVGLTDEAWRVLRCGLAYPSQLCPSDAGKFLSDLEAAQRSLETAKGAKRALKWRGLAAIVGLVLALGLGIYALVPRGGEPGKSQSAASTAAETVQGPNTTKIAPQSLPQPVTGLAQTADHEADRRAFESAKRVDTLVAYQLYLQRCPQCGFEQEAHKAIQHLQTEEKVSKIKTDFETLMREFEQENGENQADEALERLNALAELAQGDPLISAGRRRVALAWVARSQASANKGDLVTAQRALKKAEFVQPELAEVANLANMLKKSEVIQRAKQADSDAFAAARRANNRKAYWAYLDHCAGACSYRAEAETALQRLGPSNAVLRDRLADGSQGPEMIMIPAGRFEMGSPTGEKGRYEDERQHTVALNKAFAIGKYEVMFFEFDRFAAAKNRVPPLDQGWGRNRRPVVNVNWRDAKDFTEWLSEQTGHRYRLPTEAEWEYAARAGTTSSRYWSDDPDQGCAYANIADQDGKKIFVGWNAMQCRDGNVYTAPVGTYRNNDYGLHDMLGNVLEWTCTRYTPDYQAPTQTCQELEGDQQFVVRGGSWNDEPRNVRAADRHRNQPDFRDYFLGFRVVRELP
jgi:formylglycine-generating enzyme required for sulfatase activity